MTRPLRNALLATSLLLLASEAAAESPQGSEGPTQSLAEQARDPTASLTAFQITYRYVASYHGLDATSGALVLQPVIPFQLGGMRNIARISASLVTHGPDLGAIAKAPPDLPPPNQIPMKDLWGLQDMAVLDVVVFPAPFGRWGVGGVVSLPTATDPALGSEKWSLGPALVIMTRLGGFQGGLLVQGLFSVAGKSSREDVDVVTLQPFGGFGLPGDWSIGLSEINYAYDTRGGKWASVPFGLRLEKLLRFGSLPVRVYGDVEYGFLESQISPRWTFRLTFSPLIGGK